MSRYSGLAVRVIMTQFDQYNLKISGIYPDSILFNIIQHCGRVNGPLGNTKRPTAKNRIDTQTIPAAMLLDVVVLSFRRKAEYTRMERTTAKSVMLLGW